MQEFENWKPVVPMFRKTLATGELSSPPELLMRKRENGVWSYRRPSEDETQLFKAIDAW